MNARAGFEGLPIEIRYRAGLRDTAGNPAHAATFIRRRLIELDTELRGDPLEHRRILLHELFHFAWVRLGNPKRRAWEAHLREEIRAGARGEAGWSAEWRREALTERDIDGRTRRWREYCCESFCDTGAWVGSGGAAEVTLAGPYRRPRRVKLTRLLCGGPIRI